MLDTGSKFGSQGRSTCLDEELAVEDEDVCPEAWCIGKTVQMLQQLMNGHRTTIVRQKCSLLVGEHFSSQTHSAFDLRASVLQSVLRDTQQRRIAEQKLIAKFFIHEDGLNRDLGLMWHY
eukprot:g21419.t1